MEDLLKTLGIEEGAVDAMVQALVAGGVPPTPFRVQWKKGMKFSIKDCAPNVIKDKDGNPTSDPFPMFLCDNGGTISPKHFQDVKGEVVPLENSHKGLAIYTLAHVRGNTVFRVKDYTASEGTFGTSDYQPTVFKLEIVSTDIEGEE